MATSLVKILVHLVFSTKHRVPLIDATLRSELYPYMIGIVRRKGGTVIALGGMPDHVHVLLRLKAETPLADLVRALKAGSSKWVHDRPEAIPTFAWQTGYAGFSVSQSMERAVKSYILNQEEHHRSARFDEELVTLLKRHEVDFKPEFLFD